MARRVLVLLVPGLVLMAARAPARPADRIITLGPGDLTFERAARGSWQVYSTDPSVVRARYFEAGEVQLEAGRAGQALVVLDNDKLGQFLVWQVFVGSAPRLAAKKLQRLSAICHCRRDEDVEMLCTISDGNCLDYLQNFFSREPVSSRQVGVIYTVATAQQQLRYMTKKLAEAGFQGVELAFWGANLRVKARVASAGQRRRLLLELWKHMVGRLVLDDAITVSPAPGPVH